MRPKTLALRPLTSMLRRTMRRVVEDCAASGSAPPRADCTNDEGRDRATVPKTAFFRTSRRFMARLACWLGEDARCLQGLDGEGSARAAFGSRRRPNEMRD